MTTFFAKKNAITCKLCNENIKEDMNIAQYFDQNEMPVSNVNCNSN